MNRLHAAVLVAALALRAASAAAVPATAIHRLDCADSATHDIAIPANVDVVVTSAAPGVAWFDVAETGHLLVVTHDGDRRAMRIPVPFRYGVDAVELAPAHSLRIRRGGVTTQAVVARVTVQCDDTATPPTRRDWLARFAAVAARLGAMVPADAAPALLADVDAIAASADGARDRALATHLRAQALLMCGRSADTAGAFADAERGWLAIGDAERARVARVGEVEELLRLARHDEVARRVDDVAPALAERDYMAARLQLAGCLSLRYQGRMPEALACFRRGVANMQQLGEQLDLVSALQDMADVSRFLGDTPAARKLGEQALAQCTLPAMESHRGRIQLMLADIALESGDIPRALLRFDAALSEFAAAKWPRWEANALLRTADLYVELGALEEASDFVAAALTRLSERDAPARVASARATQARIDLRNGELARARETLDTVAASYATLKMPAELDGVRVARARVALQDGDVDGADAIAASRDKQQTLNRDDWRLLEARIAAHRAACPLALSLLAPFDGRHLALARDLDRVEIVALCLAQAGDHDGAAKRLMAAATGVTRLARDVGSPVLRQVLASYIAPLRRAAFRLAFDPGRAATPDIATVWLWSQMDTIAAAPATSERASEQTARFDEEIAQELLPSASATAHERRTPRHLLSILAGSAEPVARDTAATTVTLSALQQRLAADAAYVTYIDVGAQSRLLWITHDAARLLPTTDLHTLSVAGDDLVARSSSPDTPLQAIDDASARLSALLWSDHAGAPPATLYVDASSPLAALPWPIVRWPRTNVALLDSTRVVLARVDAQPPVPKSAPSEVTVLVSSQERGGAMPALWAARAEPDLVAGALADRGGRVIARTIDDRETLIGAFAQKQSWLHIAAHGSALPSRIGYAGIWLEPRVANEVPRFVSALEMLARGASNDLVVLNACRLGTSGSGLGFADTISRAGARDVVAARWEVSDSATTLWVPAFYRHVGASADPGAALLAAQQSLRQSRQFRHPFYWASYVHIAWM